MANDPFSLDLPLDEEAARRLAEAFSKGSLLEAFDGDDLTDEILAPSDEMARVSRRIAAQYAEVVAAFAAHMFAGRNTHIEIDQAESAIDALLRLADAAHDSVQIDLLHAVRSLIRPLVEAPKGSKERKAQLRQLREWIPRFAATLEPEDGKHLRRVLTWDDQAPPLLDELASIKGIGEKRLKALYAAGLYTVDAVASATPQEISDVTLMPLNLAEAVIQGTRKFAREEQERCLSNVREQSVKLRHLLQTLPQRDRHHFQALAEEALREVEAALVQVKQRSTP